MLQVRHNTATLAEMRLGTGTGTRSSGSIGLGVLWLSVPRVEEKGNKGHAFVQTSFQGNPNRNLAANTVLTVSHTRSKHNSSLFRFSDVVHQKRTQAFQLGGKGEVQHSLPCLMLCEGLQGV